MSTVYPGSLDSLTNPSASDSMETVSHSSQHTNINDAMEAVQAKVGVDSSAVVTSHDYLIGLNTTHRTSDGSDHTFIDQDVTSGSTPTFTNTNFTEATDKNYVTDAEAVVIGNTSGTNTGDEPDANLTTKGIIEIATAAETTTGTDATRAVSPDGLAGSDYGKRILEVMLLDDTTDNATGDGAGDVTFTVPSEINGWNLVNAQAAVEVAGVTGTQDIQIYNVTQTADMLSTKITIDTGELTSYTAATAPVIDTSNDDVSTGDALRFDVDAVHSGTAAKGLKVILTFQLP